MSQTPGTVGQGTQALIGNYARIPLSMARGEGSYVWDSDGRRYLDLFAGFGGCILGHCHPALVEAVTRQAKILWHVGNTFYTEPQIEFAQRLRRHAFEGQAFFCHSGMEANEAACKLVRLRGREPSPRRWKIISFTRSFHGRSLAMIGATGNPKVKAGFEPAVPGFVNVEPTIEAVANAIDAETGGIIMEPIQGEGGINLYPAEFPAQVRRICDQHGLTLIFDEVWTGCGRTGQWFGHQHYTGPSGVVQPDIMTLGKAIGGGLPVGVMYAKPEIAKLMVPGTHGSTLGGNAVCMAVSRTIFDVIEREGLVQRAAELGELAIARLRNEPKVMAKVADVRGRGLLLGVELKNEHPKVVEKGLENGVILNLTAQKVIRLAPALTIGRAEWEEGLNQVVRVIAELT